MAPNPRVLAVSSMNGGAEAIAPVIKRLRERDCNVHVLAHRAAGMTFKNMGVAHEHIEGGLNEMASAFISTHMGFAPDLILMGTQIQDRENVLPIEHFAARVAGRIPTLAVLDTWGNYVERFSELDLSAEKPPFPIAAGGKLVNLPTRIAVMDGYARNRMRWLGSIDLDTLIVTGNPYFEHVALQFAQLPATTRQDVLAKPVFSAFNKDPDAKLVVFMSDSMSDYPDIGFTEQTVLASFMRVLDEISKQTGMPINLIVRPHPFRTAGAAEAYASFTPTSVRAVMHNPVSARGNDPVNDYTMEQLLASADLVVGTFNNPLITAKVVGKPVINYLPGLTSPKYDFQGFMSEQGLSTNAVNEIQLANAVAGIFSGQIVQKSMDSVHGAIDNVTQLVYQMAGLR